MSERNTSEQTDKTLGQVAYEAYESERAKHCNGENFPVEYKWLGFGQTAAWQAAAEAAVAEERKRIFGQLAAFRHITRLGLKTIASGSANLYFTDDGEFVTYDDVMRIVASIEVPPIPADAKETT